MTDDMQAARAAFEAWLGYAPERHTDGTYDSGFTDEDFRVWLAAWNASRSIPAAAALLRAEGWTVEEPRCETCGGEGTIPWSMRINRPDFDCPTCNGTGARKVKT